MKGIFAALGSSFIYGMIPTMETYIVKTGTPVPLYTAVMVGLLALISFVMAKVRKESVKISGKQLLFCFLGGVLGNGLCIYLLATSYTYIPTGFSTMLHFMYPVFVCIVMTAVFKEKFTSNKAIAIGFMLVGLFLLAGSVSQLSLKGTVLALLSGFCWGTGIILNDKSCIAEIPDVPRTFWLASSSALFFIVLSVIQRFTLPADPMFYGMTAVVSVANFIAMLLVLFAIKAIGSSQLSLLSIAEPVVSLLLSAFVYRYSISARELAGCVCIVIALIFTAVKAEKKS